MHVECIDYELGKVQYYKNLAVVPLLGNSRNLDFLVLSEAMNKGLEVKEDPDEVQQNNIYVNNKTSKIVLGILGEIITGLTQNRNFVRNAIFDIDFNGLMPVNCAQAGQPTRSGAVFDGHGGIAPSSVSNSNQRGAWDTIYMLNSETKVFSDTSDLSEVYSKRKNYFQEFSGNYSKMEGQLGFITGFMKDGEKYFVLDIFNDAKIFAKYFDKLLERNMLESGLYNNEKIELNKDEVYDFLSSLKNSEFKQISPISLGKDFKIKGHNLRGSAISYEDSYVYTNFFNDFDNGSRDNYHEIDETPTIVDLNLTNIRLNQ